MTNDELRDRVAKAIADAIGHGMREKCEHMADAAIQACHAALLERHAQWPSDEDVERARSAFVRADDGSTGITEAMRAALQAAMRYR